MLMPDRANEDSILKSRPLLTLPDALQCSLKIMANVCGWIILFRILIAFMTRWVLWLLPVPAQVAITGILELSNGCCALDKISNEELKEAAKGIYEENFKKKPWYEKLANTFQRLADS